MEYIRVTTPITKIEKDELNIIAGALSLKERTVANVGKEIDQIYSCFRWKYSILILKIIFRYKAMKKLDEVYTLPVTAILNMTTVNEIASKGYSRIPVYLDKRERVVGVLHVKVNKATK